MTHADGIYLTLLLQHSRPAGLSLAALILWPNSLEHWLATLSMLSTQIRKQVGLLVPGGNTGDSSTGLGKVQRIDRSFKANWLSYFWPGENSGLPDKSVEGRDVTTRPTCWPVAIESDPLAELIRALACDYECDINADSKTDGIVGTGT